MKIKYMFRKIFLLRAVVMIALSFSVHLSKAQNPFIRNQFTADPSARVFNNRVYVFPSHDILATKERGRVGWFCMEDYHVFSSENLTHWEDHGVIVKQNEVPWVKKNSFSMWAPDCIFRNGKYYFYFPTTPQDTTSIGRGFTVGVAIADKPTGPYVPQAQPIKSVRGIDPNVLITKDGQAYLYWSAGNIFGAKLKDNMVELATEPKILGDLPSKGLKEGPYVFERNGIYYLTYPHVENKTERLEYAISDNPLGPFRVAGVIMDESPVGCWTNHQSIIQFKNQWYLFYHHNDYSPKFDKARSVRMDSLFFNDDGSIKKVIPTLRGAGISDARDTIQIDRYSKTSNAGVSLALLDTTNTFKGWKIALDGSAAFVQYNNVDFGSTRLKSIVVSAASESGGTLQIRLDSKAGPLLAEVTIPEGQKLSIYQTKILKFSPGVHNIIIMPKTQSKIQLDWIRCQ